MLANMDNISYEPKRGLNLIAFAYLIFFKVRNSTNSIGFSCVIKQNRICQLKIAVLLLNQRCQILDRLKITFLCRNYFFILKLLSEIINYCQKVEIILE